jgi:hypothetical protein
MFYDDPHRWAFLFETNAFMTLAKLHGQAVPAPVKVMERSIHSARYCFVEHLRRRSVVLEDDGTSDNGSIYFSEILQDVEYRILDDYFHSVTNNDACALDLISKFHIALV